MPRKSRPIRREPTPEEEGQQILAAAEKAGTDYAREQLGGDYFRDWVWEQVVEADRMRQQDPDSVVPLETPADARKIARNMLQQLEWDTKRDMESITVLELSGAKGVFDSGSADWVRDEYGITYEDVSGAFFTAFTEELESRDVRQWLADMILEMDEEARGSGGKEASEERTTREGEARTVVAKNLKPGDFIRGERGSRRYQILSVKRVGGSLPIEVRVQGQGTWHFKPDDHVEIFDQALGEILRRPVVRDYVAVDHRGRPVFGPTKDYGEARRRADRARGYVKFAATRATREDRSRRSPRR
jgi:hypothetical protein